MVNLLECLMNSAVSNYVYYIGCLNKMVNICPLEKKCLQGLTKMNQIGDDCLAL